MCQHNFQCQYSGNDVEDDGVRFRRSPSVRRGLLAYLCMTLGTDARLDPADPTIHAC